MKDEVNGNLILEFVGLCAKAYTFKELIIFQNENRIIGDIVEEKKLKGIQKSAVKQHLDFENYEEAIFNLKTKLASTFSIRSHLHELRTLAIQKVAVGPYDDKRYLFQDGIFFVPYGHYAADQLLDNN